MTDNKPIGTMKERIANGELKQCRDDPAHIWMADIPYCPYCNSSPQARIFGEQQARKIEKLEAEIERLKEKGDE